MKDSIIAVISLLVFMAASILQDYQQNRRLEALEKHQAIIDGWPKASDFSGATGIVITTTNLTVHYFTNTEYK